MMRIVEIDRTKYPRENIDTADKLDEILKTAKTAVDEEDYLTAVVALLKWKPRFTIEYFAERFFLPKWKAPML